MTLKPVDTAIIMVVGPCIDDTDFKSLEEAIAYNAAGMDVSLIVEKTDGTTAVTAITLTTAGTSDWTHKDGGYYEIEITATQNAEEGIAYIRGVCTGVLPFESPRYEVVKANVYDSLVKGTDVLQADVTQLAGVAQSLTDLKDFADTGYDPATNKVEGVKLTDTTTANTDMVGTAGANTVVPDAAGVAPTATEIRIEMDANSTKMAPSQTLADYKATGFNTVVPDAAGIAATPVEVAAALTNIHLDHLLAADYDPAAKPGVATALLNELVENDGGIARYTANTLEQAPSAGTNPNVLVDTTIASISTQTSFVLTIGSNDDDAYKNQAVVIYDVDDSNFPSIRTCSAYVGATKTITLNSAPDFTIVSGDGCKIFVTAPGTSAPTVSQIRTEMEGAGYKLALIEADTNNLQTNQGSWATATGFNTVVPDAAGVAPTVSEIRIEMDANSTKMAPSQTLADYKANVSALATTAALTTHDGKLDVVDAIVDRIVATTEIKYGLSVNDVSATTTKFISTLAETQNDFWNRAAVLFTSGNNAGQLRRIKDYNGTTKEIVIQTPLDAAPANGDTFIMPAIRAFITPDIEDIVDQTWDALIADHTVVNSFGAKNQKVVPSETTDDYKATGFSIPNEYDTAISALQTDLDNPDQYKANVSDIALEATLTSMKGATFNGTTDSLESIRDRGDDAWLTGAGGSAPTVSEIRIEMDTNSTKMSPSQTLADYKADVSTLATATALSAHDDKLDTIDTIVNAILIDTSTTLENHLTDIKGTGFVKDISSLPQCLTAAGFSTHDAAAVKTALEADDGKLYSVYAALLNKMTVTSSLMSIYKDDAATLLKSLNLSDDTITVTRT